MMCKGMEDWKQELLGEGKKEGIKEGIKEGRLKGRSEGKAESTIELLEEVGTVSIDLKEKIMSQKDMDVLTRWLKLSAKVSSVEEFEKAM